MATKIVTKNSSTASAVPTASDLVQGELAVNVADKRLFTEDNGGAIVELGVNPAAEITANAGIALPDNQKATFGTGDDLQIYHTGAASKIVDAGTGVLEIQTNGAGINLTGNSGAEFMARFISDGATLLYNDGSAKLATTSTGIDVTGTATMDGLTVDKSSQATIVATSDSTVDVRLVADTSLTEGSIRTSGTTPNLGFYVGGTKYANISDGGDISFYEDTGTTPKLFWDASAESLGIGTSSPAGITAGVTTLSISDTGSKTTGDKIGQLSFITDDSSFIPTYSDGVGAEISAVSTSAVGGAYGLSFVTSTTTGSNRAERMRIDSSGNLLVGKSASSFNAAGAEIRTSGVVIGTVDGAAGLIANRLTSDGTLIQLSKDGTTVGSIGYNSSTGFYMHSPFGNDSGLVFGSERIVPCTSAGAFDDAVVDLGYSSGRFKDLYLSGGVYLGGTGAVNKLDDYEEGTWTPVPKGSTTAGTISIPAGHQTGTYTKVGELVHISMFLYGTNFTGAGTFEIHGLPFSHAGSSGTLPVQINNPPWDTLPADNQNITGYLSNNTTMTFRASNRNKNGSHVLANVTSPSTIGYLRVNGTYRTTA